MIKSYQQIKREKTKKESRLQKVRRFFGVSRLSLENKISEWKLQRMRRRALRAENTGNGSLYKAPENNFKFRISNFESIFNDQILNFKTFRHSFKIQNLKLKIQKPTWRFRLNLNSKLYKKAFALVTIFAVIVTAYWQNTPQGQTKT